MLKKLETPVAINPPSKPLGWWESYRTLRRNMLELIPEEAYYEKMVIGGGNAGWVILTDPDAVKHVLKDRSADYTRPPAGRRVITPRDGGVHLATAEHEEWRRLRKLMAPTYAPRHMQNHSEAMIEAAAGMVGRIENRKDDAIDLLPIMQSTTRDVMCDLLLSGKEVIDRDAYTACIDAGVTNMLKVSLLDLLGAPDWVPRPARVFNFPEIRLNRLLDEIIAKRIERGPSEKPDLLDLLIAARDEHSGLGLSAADLRNNVSGSLYAGLETTALAVCWSTYLLSLYPHIQEQLAEEAQSVLGGRIATLDDLPNLPYTLQVVRESMRLYPPGAMLARRADVEDEILGRRIAKGTNIIIPTYTIHRHRALWEDPDRFDPDRFEESKAKGYHPFAFMPFGGGPRICVAWAFAMVEVHMFLATLCSRYRFELQPGFQPEPRMIFALHPANGMQVTVSER
ncbi:MAG: cytochrome P450 [Pseudomonadota bacterium]